MYLILQVGNAAYHDDRLYDQLQRCIPHLTRLLLEDEEDKTKANAAGALSNLVRNSSRLCEDIIAKGAMQVCCLFSSQILQKQVLVRIDVKRVPAFITFGDGYHKQAIQ